MMGLVELALL